MTNDSRSLTNTSADIASLAVFRIVFGVLMFAYMVASLASGHVADYWIKPVFHFAYPGFEWFHLPRGAGAYAVYAFLGIAALGIATGTLYRIASAAFFAGFACVFVSDAAAYRSCDYLILLISGIMAVVPAHRALSFDARRGIATSAIPSWPVWLLRFQFAVVYLFNGIARLNHTWLAGEPVSYWLGMRTKLPVIGPELAKPWVTPIFAYGLPVFDLAIVPLLLWRRTRVPAFLIACGFHLTNGALLGFDIGTWLMIAGTLMFLAPGWPRTIGWIDAQPALTDETPRNGIAAVALVAIYALVQLAIPMRHLLYPGDANWTCEGDRFSWRMKSRSKEATAIFYVTDARQNTRCIDPIDELSVWQIHSMASRPDQLVQYARHLADLAQSPGGPRPEVRVRALCALNGRLPRLLVDTNLDLAAQSVSFAHAAWILSPTNAPVNCGSASEQELLASHYRETRASLAKLDKLDAGTKPAAEGSPRQKTIAAIRANLENKKRSLLEQLQDVVLSCSSIEDPARAD